MTSCDETAFIHVDPMNPVALNYTCRYCPDCDLLIAHQDQIEELLAVIFVELDPSLRSSATITW